MTRRYTQKRLIELAQVVAQEARCGRSSVGALLVSPDGEILWQGFNRPAGWPDKICAVDCPRGSQTYQQLPRDAPFTGSGACIAIHAEVMACENYVAAQLEPDPQVLNGLTVVITRAPCEACVSYLRMHGLSAYWPVYS